MDHSVGEALIQPGAPIESAPGAEISTFTDFQRDQREGIIAVVEITQFTISDYIWSEVHFFVIICQAQIAKRQERR